MLQQPRLSPYRSHTKLFVQKTWSKKHGVGQSGPETDQKHEKHGQKNMGLANPDQKHQKTW
jgi:hypothetical protein